MPVDPRKITFNVTGCTRRNQIAANQSERRKSFLDGLTNLGNLEILNDIGYGRIGEGLRTLASVSDSIRSGTSVVPGREGTELFNTTLGRIANTAEDSINEGANVVLDACGISPASATGALASVNPGVANRAVGQAKDIYSQVKSGNFSLSDIPQVFTNLQNLEILARGIYTSDEETKRTFNRCIASPYAVDLIRYAPKFKFLFIVDFTLTPPYQPWGKYTREMAFVVKRSQRPAVEFEYEDVNMYNFRTKVARRTVYPPVTMTFYDDNKNNAFLFYTAYMRAMSPIANMQMADSGDQVGNYEARSMGFASSMNGTFSSTDPATRRYAASLGPLNDGVRNVVGRIRLFQVFDYGRAMNIYNFYNPRVLNFGLDELNMAESGDGSEFEFTFDYDGMYVQPGWDVHNTKEINIRDLSGGNTLFYPIDPIFNEDDNQTDRAQQAPTAQDQENHRTVIDEVTGFFDPISGLAQAGSSLGNAFVRQGSRLVNEVGTQAAVAINTVKQTAAGVLDTINSTASAPMRRAQQDIKTRVAIPSTFTSSTTSPRRDTSRSV